MDLVQRESEIGKSLSVELYSRVVEASMCVDMGNEEDSVRPIAVLCSNYVNQYDDLRIYFYQVAA
jgi:hypothetical protein